MTRVRLGALVAAALLTALAGGCTSVSSGDPQPAGSATSSTEDTATSATPTRPREIKLDGIDPCTLLPQADYADFELDNEPGKPKKDDHGADKCLWQGHLGYMSALLITYEGIEAKEGRSGQIESTDPIEDFPAYDGTLPNEDQMCFVFVDVADGQYLDVQVGLDFAPTDRPTCDYAHDFATSIMSTLVKQ